MIMADKTPKYSNIEYFPPYAFVPGYFPHPNKDPEGHSYGKPEPQPEKFDPGNWQKLELYLYGIDLFNRGYYWEAHETWEALWRLEERDDPTELLLHGLIKLAAAGVKVRQNNPKGIRSHARGAKNIFGKLRSILTEDSFCGFSISLLENFTAEIEANIDDFHAEPTISVEIVFDRMLVLNLRNELNPNDPLG